MRKNGDFTLVNKSHEPYKPPQFRIVQLKLKEDIISI